MGTDGYVVTERFTDAMRSAAATLGEVGETELTPVEQALAEDINALWAATAQAILELEVRVGPTAANPKGHAALVAFARSKGIDIT